MNMREDARSLAVKFKTTNVVLIDRRGLERECFVRGVEAMQPMTRVEAFGRVADWIEQVGDGELPTAVLYNVEGRRIADEGVADEIAAIEKAARPVPVIVLSPFEDLSEIITALDCGARGYIPACLGIDATLTAVRLAAEGGVFLPPGSVLAMRHMVTTRRVSSTDDYFTARQAAVAERLRRGKPNKLIAYELNMCESTVKVHIRNIMKKLKVTNRTEAGFKLNSLFSDPPFGFDLPEAPGNSVRAGVC